MGSIKLEVVFRSPDNFRSEELIFDIVPFRSGYHALLGRVELPNSFVRCGSSSLIIA